MAIRVVALVLWTSGPSTLRLSSDFLYFVGNSCNVNRLGTELFLSKYVDTFTLKLPGT